MFDYCEHCWVDLTPADIAGQMDNHLQGQAGMCLECWRAVEKGILDDMIKQYPYPLPPVE